VCNRLIKPAIPVPLPIQIIGRLSSISWIERGAVLYVCGSIDGMASGVDQALIEILGEEQVDELRQQGRYRRDVY